MNEGIRKYFEDYPVKAVGKNLIAFLKIYRKGDFIYPLNERANRTEFAQIILNVNKIVEISVIEGVEKIRVLYGNATSQDGYCSHYINCPIQVLLNAINYCQHWEAKEKK